MIGKHRISLDCLSLTSSTIEELIRSAGAAGFDLVSLWLNPAGPFPQQIVGRDEAACCASLLSEYGVGVHQIEAFDLVSPAFIEACRPCFALGAELGARSVLFYNGSADDRTSAVAALRAACRIAGDYGLSVNIEPVSFSRLRTLREAQELIEDSGVDAGIVLDFLHFIRSGNTLSDLQAIDQDNIRYVQVNDGPLLLQRQDARFEAMMERLVPGEGAFPIQDLLRILPGDVIVGVEVPRHSAMKDKESPPGHALELMAALSDFLL